jgi:hypothetical protein
LELYGPDGRLAASNDDSFGTNSQIAYYPLPADGAYTIVARTFATVTQPAFYNLKLALGALTTPGQSIAYGQSVTGELTVASDNWTFEGSLGESVIVKLSSDEFDPKLLVRGPDGAVLGGNDDFDGSNSQVVLDVLPVTGTYTITVTAYGGTGSGSYSLSLDEIDIAPPGAIRSGESVTGRLAADSTGDRWTFTGSAGDTVTIVLSSAAFDTVVELRGPNGGVLTSNDDYAGTDSQITDFPLPATGTYIILVRGFSAEASGSYQLTLR